MRNNAFTLIEILVVVAIVGILSGFIFYTVQNNVSKANIAKSQVFSESIRNNLLLNLVSEWKLDNNANDAWGTNNGTDTNVTYLSSSQCISGQCGSFNGTSSYIRIPDTTAFNFGSQMSAFVWAKGAYAGGSHILIGQLDYGIDERAWVLYPLDGRIRGYVSSDGGNISIMSKTSTDVVFDNNWHLYGFSFDAGTIKIYVDSEEVSGTTSGNVSSIHNSTADMTIGCDLNSDTPAYLFNGSIDEIQLYNSVVSSSQIKQNYLSGLNNLLSQGLISEEEYNQRISKL